MKYSYKKSAFLIQMFIVYLSYPIVVLADYYFIHKSIDFTIKMSVGLLVVGFLGYFPVKQQYANRCVEFFDETVRFTSFRVNSFKLAREYKNGIIFNTRYNEIISIESRKLPLLGVYGVAITAKNIPQKLVVTWCFENHKEIISKLCDKVKAHNPQAYIDERVTTYCQGKN